MSEEDWNIPKESEPSPIGAVRERGHDPFWRWVVLSHFLELSIPEGALECSI